MKPLIILLSLCFAFSTAALKSSYAQGDTKSPLNKVIKKEREKEYKKKRRQLKRANYYEVLGSSSMEMALLNWYEKKYETENNHELIVIVSNCPTEGLAIKKTLADAITQYAAICKNEVEAKITGDATIDEINNKVAFDKFYEAYVIYVKASASQILNNYHVTFIKKNKTRDGITYTYQTWYMINEELAAQLRVAAATKALEETKTLIEYGNAIEEYVKQPVDLTPKNE